MHLLSGYDHAISLAIVGLLALAMLLVVLLDISRYTIPNSLNLAILAVYAFGAFFLHLPWIMALAAAAIVLLVGIGMFTLGLVGGGDAKLLAVLTLWTGWSMATLAFLMWTALLGGLLVIVVLTLRAMALVLWQPEAGRNLPRLLTRKQPVPYGVAIAAAFLLMLAMGSVPGLPKML